MSIIPEKLYPPQPSTNRSRQYHLSYDSKNDRVVYTSGKSVFVRPADPENKTSESKQFTKHTFNTTVAKFAPSGNYVSSGDECGNVKIWDSSVLTEPENNKFEQPYIKSEFQVLSGPISDTTWDADGTRIISVGEGKDKFGHCFTWDSGNSIGEIQGHSSEITAVDIKPQRPYRAATVGEGKALVFYTGPPFKFDKSTRGHHSNIIRDVKFSPDGKWIVSVGSDRVVCLYDGKTGEFVSKIESAHNGGIFGIAWYSDSTKFVTCSADNTVKEWSVDPLKEVYSYVVDPEPKVQNQQVGVIMTNKYIISLSLDGSLNYFVEGSAQPAAKLLGHQGPITALHYVPSSGKLYSGSSDGRLLTWAVAKDEVPSLSLPSALGKSGDAHKNYVSDIRSAQSYVLTTGWDDRLLLWKDNDIVADVTLESGQPKQIEVLSETLVAVLFESKVEIYKIVGSEISKSTSIDLGYTSSSFAVVPGSSKILVSNSSRNSIDIYEFTEDSIKKMVEEFPSFRSVPALVKVSPNGKFAAVGDVAGKYTVFNNDDLSILTTRWAFHNSRVVDAKWSPDSKFLLSCGLDSGIFLYSVEKPSKVLKFPLAHQNGVNGVEWFNYDFDKSQKASFVSAGPDGVLKTWSIDLSPYSS
ncbi:Piso0_005860 [Millerozyma farinosa CBS 7064]|uniref:Piso0_005860 protein n=1 Tax=Pichia sorbitophila (strain ATCC MYA-4447 / BCRC 22081 / CBS 7064 / NBRC 10061 / NRRL Y-12695) TaxID=559304 RepID=G8Y342_PICSO|nr:Piso0_005860 [Millerozyma farinosa CBS 7064]